MAIKKNGILANLIKIFLIIIFLCLHVAVFIFLIILYFDYGYHHPPKDSHYIKMLEERVGESLLSSKVIAKEYSADEYEKVIYKLEPDDYQKIYLHFNSNEEYTKTSKPVYFNSMETMLRKIYLKPEDIKIKYPDIGYGDWGFNPPDIILYKED